MDLILDATGSFSWVQGYYVGPVISLDARRPTLDQPHPIHGSSPQNPESDEVPTRTTNLGDPMDPLGPAALHLEVDPATWAYTQFAAARLGDRRRTARLVDLAAQVAGDPSSSLPKQTRTWGDLKAAYRLLDRPEATFQAIASPHWQLTTDQAVRAAG